MVDMVRIEDNQIYNPYRPILCLLQRAALRHLRQARERKLHKWNIGTEGRSNER